MTTDLWMLVASGVLCLLLTGAYGVGRSQMPGGLEWGFGNAHAVVYTAGIKVVRTLVFFVGLVGEVLILIQLFR